MTTNYKRNFIVATNKAAKKCGVDATELRKNYRNFNNAPAEIKHALIMAYRIMNSYAKAAAVATEPAEEQ
jgi:hypothetical protein